MNLKTNGTCTEYTISKGESDQIETTQFNSLDNSISCSCQMFETWVGYIALH